jgi:hypothetical protein
VAHTYVWFLGMILGFCFTTPFMMPSTVLEPEPWVRRRADDEYLMACKLLVEPVTEAFDTGSMPRSRKKLYTSCKKNKKIDC